MTSSSPPPDATEVDLLLRLARRWRSLGLQEAAGHALSPHQERALLALARLSRRMAEDADDDGGGVRVSHLADHLGIAPRSATEVADALEAAGLLSRSPDPTDRRAVLLALTPEGRHTVGRVRDRRRAAADAAVSALSPADRAELRRLLQELLEA
ncbi:MarR family winged helix-turn-helix transcriptional regulator [Ornithinimicrobium cerasi]|uniref:MarR family winged helix-turn-helix transcriptional regulator n=1 Tax=Ornithinimicrobium cerasi TaxID=2248773 RepID=UPI000EFFAA3B|nr:MarR family transcriptional regulator [Ornithinimicrobium cerasi]